MRTADLSIRAAVVVAAAAAVLLGAPSVVTSVLVTVAAFAVAHALVSGRGRGGVEAVLLGSGGLLVLLVVLGFALDLVGLPLRASTWAVSLAIVSLVALAVRARRATPAPVVPRLRRRAVRDGLWFVAAGCVVAAAIGVSVRSVDDNAAAPVAMSVGPVQGVSVEVLLTADESAGPFELRTDASDGNTVSYPLLTLRAGQPLTTTVALPERGRYVITLNNPGEDNPVRSVTVDR